MSTKMLIVIPCLNEEKTIAQTIKRARDAISPYEIWVIDNGSIDDTVAIARQAGAVVHQSPKKGKGFALRTAINRIPDHIEYILMVDGDDTYDYSAFSTAFHLISEKGYDMVIGNRQVAELPNHRNEFRTNPYRAGHQIGNKLLTLGFKVLFGVFIEDTLSGWRLMSVGFLRSFPGGAGGFELETELNVHAYTLSAAVAAVNVSYQGRVVGSKSKLNTYQDGWRIVKKLIKLFFVERPKLAYTLLSLPCLLTGAALLQRALTGYLQTGLVTNFPSLITAVGVFLASILLWSLGVVLENFRIMNRALIRNVFIENSK